MLESRGIIKLLNLFGGKHNVKKTLYFALTLVLVLGMFTVPAFAATTVPAPTPAPTPTQSPSGELNQKLVGTWNIGASTLEIRRILKGNYGDIKRISSGTEGVSYTFNADGTFILIGKSSTQSALSSSFWYAPSSLGILIIVDGRYSVSNDIITLTYMESRSTFNPNVPFVWEQTSNLPDKSHSFEFGYDERWEQDYLYLDGSDVGYYRAEDL